MILVRTIYLIIVLFSSSALFAQKDYFISYENDSYQQFIKHPKTKFKDSTSASQYIKSLQISAIAKGYILASVDSIAYSPNAAVVNFQLGDKMGTASISVDPEEAIFIRKHSRINEKFISQIPFTPGELASALVKIQEAYLDNGYPFVSLQLQNHRIESNQLTADLNIKKGPYCMWNIIHIRGDSSVSSKYISNLINIKVGDKYVESEIGKISGRIEQVPFLKEIKPSEILFVKDGAELFVYLESVPISSVNGIVGFQPNPTTKKLELTGEINLKLLDVLHRGELLDIRWQSIQDQTQSLKSRLNYPFLFNTPFGIDGTFDLYKRDTSFLELGATAGVQYFLNRGSYLKAFYSYSSSSVLSGGNNNPLFSNLGNVKSNSYGLSYTSNRVDYLPNPSRGIKMLVEGTVGTRKSQISDTSLVEKSSIYRGKVKVEFFVPLHKRHVIRLASLTDFYSAEEIFQNEVYRYGGLTSQRGFNEDELFATTKTTATIEYRFLLDKNSHVFAFFDQSWYENNASEYYNDSPYGFGVGFSFSTNFGVFSISYALGKQLSNPVLLSNSKVHFGYIVYF
jgi:outer membrane protein assembly factor BamA